MRLSWNEIRARAAIFAKEWAAAHYERGQTQTFYNEFFDVFGVKARRVATFEEPVKKLGAKRGFIDLFWKGVLLVEQKSAGLSLARARTQALDYFPGLKEHELPRYVLLSDFQTFELIDLETREETRFALSDLPRHVEKIRLRSRRRETHLQGAGSRQHSRRRVDGQTARCARSIRLYRPRP